MASNKKYWHIQLWDGSELLYEKEILIGQISEGSMKLLLQTLVAKATLDNDEIVSLYVRKNSKIHHNYAEVRPLNDSNKKYGFTCGDGVYAVASVPRGL